MGNREMKSVVGLTVYISQKGIHVAKKSRQLVLMAFMDIILVADPIQQTKKNIKQK
jgi:hypothetical protein